MREELLKEYAEEALKNGPHRFIRPDDKIFYMDGFKDGYNLGLKAKINMTTISDAPALPAPELKCNECGKLCTPSEMTDDRRMCKDCYIKWLEGDHKELKEKNKWYSEQVCNKECAEVWGNLTKAKEIIKDLLFIYYDPLTTESDVKHHHKILDDARQFLKDSEVEK